LDQVLGNTSIDMYVCDLYLQDQLESRLIGILSIIIEYRLPKPDRYKDNFALTTLEPNILLFAKHRTMVRSPILYDLDP
jgi:hypothetical protein